MGVSQEVTRSAESVEAEHDRKRRAGAGQIKAGVLDLTGKILFISVVTIALLSLVVPTLIVIVTAFDTRSFIAFPPEGFTLRRFAEVLNSREIMGAAWVAFRNATIATVLNIVLALPAGISLVRRDFRGKSFVLAFLMSPIMLPGVVIGVSILFFYSAFGFSLSLPLLALSHMVFTFPFIVRVIISRMESSDPAIEEAAATLGAKPFHVFRYIQLPQLTPAIIGGGAFAFIISFDNVTVSLFTAPVDARPLPIVLFYIMRFDFDPLVSAVATLQILLTFLVLVIGLRTLGKEGLLRR